MREELDTQNSIPAAFFRMAAHYPEREVYGQAIVSPDDSTAKPREWRFSTYRDVEFRVRKVIAFLQQQAVGKGDRVAIISSSRPEWMESDIAILSVGGIAVSVYQSLLYEDVGYILYDSGATIVFAENQEQVDKLIQLGERPIPIAATEERAATEAQIDLRAIVAFDPVSPHPLVTQFDDILTAPGQVGTIEPLSELTREDTATLVYTSGTTGPPKGVVQTHGNHLSNCRQAIRAELVNDESVIMLFLPLAHSFARLMGYLGVLTPASLRFPGIVDPKSSKMNPASTSRDIREAQATIIPVVPRLLEKMQSGIRQKAKGGGIGGALLHLTLEAAHDVYEARARGERPSFLAGCVFRLTSGIRTKIRENLFGARFRYAVSGGAKLNPKVAVFFDSLEIEVVEGYGLTETCVATNVNRPGRKKIGTVGPVLDHDIEMRLAEDGEVLFRGPNIAKGYYGRETATRAAWDQDDWFHTGDLGVVDEDGFLSIVGRKKEILVSSYGKNIAPEDVEALLKTSEYVSQAVLIGDGRPFCSAVVSPDEAAVQRWARQQGMAASGPELLTDTRVHELIWNDVTRLNEQLASYEAVRKITIVPEEFTIENGLLTPTFKVKRRLVEERYRDQIEAMYDRD